MSTTAVNVGTPIALTSGHSGHIRETKVLALPDGGFIAFWTTDRVVDGTHLGVDWWGQRYTAGEAAVGASFAVEGTPTSTVLANGNFVVLGYETGGLPSSAWYVRIYTADGQAVGAPTRFEGGSYAMGALPTGGFVAVFSQGGIDVGNDLFVRTFDALGQPVGEGTRLNATSVPSTYGRFHQSPALAVLADGGYVVGWSGGQSGARYFGQRFDAAGNRVGAEFDIGDDLGNEPGGLKVVALDNGGFVFSWPSRSADLGQVYDAAGRPVGGTFGLPGGVDGALANGGFYTAESGFQVFGGAGQAASAPNWGLGLGPQPDTAVLANGRIVATRPNLSTDPQGRTTYGAEVVTLTLQPGAPSGPHQGFAVNALGGRTYLGETADLSDMVALFDRSGDGHTVVEHQVTNFGAVGATLVIDGQHVQLAPGATISMTPGQFASARHAGTAAGTANLGFAVLDSAGVLSNTSSAWITVEPSAAPPEVIVGDQRVFAGQEVVLSAFVDSGWYGPSRFRVTDNTASAGSGVLLLDGVEQVAGQAIEVTADQLASLTYRNGSVANSLSISAFNGSTWSAPRSFTVGSETAAPTLTVSNQVLAPNIDVRLAPMFFASDADGDTITRYRITHDGSNPGAATLSYGGVIPPNQTFEISADQLGWVSVHTGTAPSSITVSAFDGLLWSAPQTFTLSSTSAFNYTVTVSDPGSSYASSLRSVAIAALDSWARYIAGAGTIDVRIDIVDFGEEDALARGGFLSTVPLSGSVHRAGTMDELITGIDPNGAEADLVIQVSADLLAANALWFDLNLQFAVPFNRFDALTIMAHEVGHGLGFLGVIDTWAEQQSGAIRTTFDTNVSFDGGIPHYVGAMALAAQGGTIELADRDVSHLANDSSLMGAVLRPGERYGVSVLDVAMLHDAGAPLIAHAFAPRVTVTDRVVAPNAVVGVSDLIRVSDLDGDTPLRYQFELNDSKGGGYWSVHGVRIANPRFDVAPAELDAVRYHTTVKSSTVIGVRSYDGANWSGSAYLTISSSGNTAPTVAATDAILGRNRVVAGASLFSFADGDGDQLMFAVNNITAHTGAGFWMVDGERLMGEFVIAQANLHRLSYQVGAGGSNTLSIRATDGTDWSGVATFQVGTTNQAPTVTAQSWSPGRNQAIAATGMFSFADGDGDSLMFTVNNVTGDARAGFWAVDGERLMGEFIISQANLRRLSYQVGSTGSNTLSVRATDGIGWSGLTTFQVSAPPNSAPTVSASDVTLARNQVVLPAALFSFADADGDSLMFTINNVTGNPAAGFWMVDGERLMGEFVISQANLRRLSYQVGGTGTNTLSIRATDGIAASALTSFQVSAPSNNAPTVAAANLTLNPGTVLAATDLFSFADADGDALMFTVNNVTANVAAGFWAVDGERLMGEFIISQANLRRLSYQVGSGGSNTLGIRATDGMAWSSQTNVNLTAQPISAPVVVGRPNVITADDEVLANTLFYASDPDGDAIALYQFRDNSPNVGSGFFLVNGVPKAPNRVLDVAAADLGSVTFQAGMGADNLGIRARDVNGNWGAWQSTFVNDPSSDSSSATTVWTGTSRIWPPTANTPPTVTASDALWQPRNANRSLLDLVVMYDSDSGYSEVGNNGPMLVEGVWISGQIQTLEFRDDTGESGTGYFVLNGVAQSGSTITVSAADFNAGNFAFRVGGPSLDHLQVRVSDGIDWSDWDTFDISSTNVRPSVTQAGSWMGIGAGQAAAVAPMFTVSDPDGDTATRYQFVDGTLDGGRFLVGGNAQAADQIIDVLASQLAATQFQASNTAGGSDALFARAFDGVAWSAWRSWNIVAQA
ncbi:MAG: hypothetical protein SFV21_06090 [Rhodospirillaceae bacterium]|nr:hypothetical protein [Rhodospirillaceae bacterium]